ncbi:hypothetical protein FGG78_38405, partial [Thioclava sp. BHET1]
MEHQDYAGGPARNGQLAEVWGDVVARPALARALVIGAVVSVFAYWLGLQIFPGLAASKAEGRALAMLLGIVGCV